MRSTLAKSILLVSSLVLIAGCSSGNGSKLGTGGGGNGDTNGSLDKFTRPGKPGTTPFTQQGWCADIQGQDRNTYIVRYKFDDGGALYFQIWQLDVNRTPVAEHNKGTGRWELNGAELTTYIEGNAKTFSIRLDPGVETRTLYVDQGNGNEFVYKPCL